MYKKLQMYVSLHPLNEIAVLTKERKYNKQAVTCRNVHHFLAKTKTFHGNCMNSWLMVLSYGTKSYHGWPWLLAVVTATVCIIAVVKSSGVSELLPARSMPSVQTGRLVKVVFLRSPILYMGLG